MSDYSFEHRLDREIKNSWHVGSPQQVHKVKILCKFIEVVKELTR